VRIIHLLFSTLQLSLANYELSPELVISSAFVLAESNANKVAQIHAFSDSTKYLMANFN